MQENPCQHPVIILKDVKHTEVISLLKFIYQGEVNIKQDELSTFLKVAQMLQIKGLEGGEGHIIPLLNDYVNVSDPHDLKDVTALSDVLCEQEGKNKTPDESVHSRRIANRNTKTRKKQVVKDNYNSIKKLKNESNVDSKDDICLLSDNDEKSDNVNDSNYEKDIRCNKTSKAIDNSEKIIELSNEQNLEGTSLLQSGILLYYS